MNPGLSTKEIKGHKKHEGRKVDMKSMHQIKKVDRTATQFLAICGCGFYGWIENTNLEEWTE